MKAARLYEAGKPLKVEDVAEPTLRSGSAIVRVLCAHIPSFTNKVISGELGYSFPEIPFTPGTSAIGIIEAVADCAAVLVGLAMGAAKVIAVGRNQEQLKTLEQLDKRVIGVATEGNLESDAKAIANACNGGADVVIDLLGGADTPEPTLTCLNALRRGGTAVFVGGVSVDIPIPYSKIMLEQLTIKGSFMYPRHIPGKLLKMISAGILNLDAIKIDRFSLDEIETAISKASTSKGIEYCVLVVD